MTCKRVDLGGGAFVIACSRGPRQKPCSVPGCGRGGSKLCDFPVSVPGKRKTCDAPLCDRHARRQGPDLDYCPPHANLETSRR